MSLLSLMLQVWGLIAVLVITFVCRRKAWAIAIGPVLMFVVNVVAQIVVAGEGPGACAGALVLPLCGLFVSWATLKMTKHLGRPRKT